MIIQCCVCKKYREDGGWHKTSSKSASAQKISHGYCPQCAEKVYTDLREEGKLAKLTSV